MKCSFCTHRSGLRSFIYITSNVFKCCKFPARLNTSKHWGYLHNTAFKQSGESMRWRVITVNTLLPDTPFTTSVLTLASTVLDVAWTRAPHERDSLLRVRIDTQHLFVARLVLSVLSRSYPATLNNSWTTILLNYFSRNILLHSRAQP